MYKPYAVRSLPTADDKDDKRRRQTTWSTPADNRMLLTGPPPVLTKTGTCDSVRNPPWRVGSSPGGFRKLSHVPVLARDVTKKEPSLLPASDRRATWPSQLDAPAGHIAPRWPPYTQRQHTVPLPPALADGPTHFLQHTTLATSAQACSTSQRRKGSDACQ